MKKIVLILAVGVVMMVGCKKTEEGDGPSGWTDTVTPTQPTDTTQVGPLAHRNVELVYGRNSDDENQWRNISLDTLRKYSADTTVDTIFMIPEMYDQYNARTTAQLQYIIPKFRERRNVNPEKIRGRGELQLNSQSVVNNYEIVRFFKDTMGYTVTYYETK